MPERHWLMKSEPDVYSIDDLKRDERTFWEGVRNFQARNLLRDELQKGDRVLFYHSNAKPPGVAGLARVVEAGSPDPVQFDPASHYHDPKSTRDNPRWYGVTIAFEKKLPTLVSLDAIKETAALAEMVLVKSSRLSVQPVTAAEYRRIAKMGGL